MRGVGRSVSVLFLAAGLAAVGPSIAHAEPPAWPPGMEDGIARTSDGARKYMLVVTEDFSSGALQAIGGRLEWQWPEAGLVVASSTRDTFLEDARSAPELGATAVVPAVLALSPDQMTPPLAEAPPEGPRGPEAPQDAYLGNLQWTLQAIGAVRHEEDGRTPVWQLDQIDGHPYEGLGTTVCFLDDGMPAMGPYDDPQLHEDYSWYTPDKGGIVPVFPDQPSLDAYHAAHGGDEGMDPSTAIFDPALGGFDLGHATSGSAIFNVRYKPGKAWAMRGIAPGAKAISYNTLVPNAWHDPDLVLQAMARASGDGCQVIAHSFGLFFSKNVEMQELVDGQRQVFMRALQALNRQDILVVAPAGHWGVSTQDLHQSEGGPWWVLPQNYPPNVLVVGGTAPRDYSPDAPDLRVYDPTPGVPRGTEHNLDRPGAFEPPIYTTDHGKQMAGLDLVAPSGSAPSGIVGDPNGYFVPIREFNGSYGYHGLSAATSQAMPTVAGVASLAIESYTRAHGNAPTVARLKQILLRSADDLVGPERDEAYLWSADRSPTGSFVWDYFYRNDEAWALEEIDVEKPGKDDFLGSGRVNVVEAIREAKR